jgi:hypothetical protein
LREQPCSRSFRFGNGFDDKLDAIEPFLGQLCVPEVVDHSFSLAGSYSDGRVLDRLRMPVVLHKSHTDISQAEASLRRFISSAATDTTFSKLNRSSTSFEWVNSIR